MQQFNLCDVCMHPERANIAMKPDKDQTMERKAVIESDGGKKNAAHELQKAKIHGQFQDKRKMKQEDKAPY